MRLMNLTAVVVLAALLPAAREAPQARSAESTVTPAVKSPEQHEKFVRQAKQGKIDLLFLGDNLLERWPRDGKGSWGRFAKYKPANFSISGDHTENLLWRITNGELEEIAPKLVVVLIGTNNIGHFKDKAEWVAAGVKKNLDTIQEKLPDARIVVLGIFPRSARDSAVRKLIDETNPLIAKFDDGKKVFYLDVGSKFLDANGNVPTDLMADGLNPTAKGYQLWFDTMEGLIDEMMTAE